jgi:hypothetical protein
MSLNRDIKKGSMREVVAGAFEILRKDEELMRALCYLPEDTEEDILHPMDELLPNIVDEDNETYWETVDNHIKLHEKITDIENKSLCRLYIYLGRRRPVFNNYLIAQQEIIIDIFVHNDYSDNMRIGWISDRINELIALKRLNGTFGKLEYASGNSRDAPIGYSKYQHMFVFATGKR